MKKERSVYDDIFDAYEMKKYYSQDEKNTIRHYVRRYIKNYKSESIANKPWEKVPQMEKDFLIYIELQDYLKGKLHENQKSAVERKIAKKAHKLLTNIHIEENNQAVSKEPYIRKTDSEEEQRKGYDRYKKDCEKYLKMEPKETFEEFIQGPVIRPYDIFMSAQEESRPVSVVDEAKNRFLTEELQWYITQTICQILKEKLKVTIDIKKIKECLEYLYDHNYDFSEPIPTEIDPQSPFSEEEQLKLINDIKKISLYQNELDTLNFWQEEGKSGSSR